MQLHAGKQAEYKARHDAIWPELSALLKGIGISDYRIFLNEGTGSLLGVLTIEDASCLDILPQHPVMQKWWAYMADIMETHPDNAPISIPLREVFHLP